MRKAFAPALVSLAAAVVTWASPPASQAAGPAAGWEYRVLTKEQVLDLGKRDLAAGLNRLGAEGWELAAIDAAYIFKRPLGRKTLEDAKRRVAAAESEVEAHRERVAWAERMAKKGYLGEAQLRADAKRLKEAEGELDEAQKALKAIK